MNYVDYEAEAYAEVSRRLAFLGFASNPLTQAEVMQCYSHSTHYLGSVVEVASDVNAGVPFDVAEVNNRPYRTGQ